LFEPVQHCVPQAAPAHAVHVVPPEQYCPLPQQAVPPLHTVPVQVRQEPLEQ
jgi:hypothetical protein